MCILFHLHTYMHVICVLDVLSGSSMQMAQEVLKSGPVDGEERDKEGGGGEGRAAFEGMEALARAIETGETEFQS